MKNKPTKISVIIPVRPRGEVKIALKALSQARYPAEFIEALASFGFSPSRQRNEAAKKARGEILYFLDNDSEVHPMVFQRILPAFLGKGVGKPAPVKGFSVFPPFVCRLIEKTFFSSQKSRGEIAVVGGPNVWEKEESFWASMMTIIMKSFFAYSKMCSRFLPVGKFRRTDEKEFILCNLAVKRKIFYQVRGFREELYPNEENEFLNRLKKAGYGLIYHPGIVVDRPRRETFSEIIKMFFNYGRGRMEQIRVEGIWQSLLFLTPLIFLFYLLSLIFYRPWFYLLPLVFYFFLGFWSALGYALRLKKPSLSISLPFLFLISHLSYGGGLLYGLGTNLERKRERGRKAKIQVVRMKSFGQKAWTV